MQLTTIRIDKPDATNFILGQTHFIKSVEDIHETLVGAVPGIKFGLAFCEASGKCLVRSSGTDTAMIELAQKNAMALGAGHCFIVFLGEGYYPVNVLNAIKNGSGGMPNLLRDRESGRGGGGRDRAGKRIARRNRRANSEGDRGRG
jgi:adenosine/AMP kinase